MRETILPKNEKSVGLLDIVAQSQLENMKLIPTFDKLGGMEKVVLAIQLKDKPVLVDSVTVWKLAGDALGHKPYMTIATHLKLPKLRMSSSYARYSDPFFRSS